MFGKQKRDKWKRKMNKGQGIMLRFDRHFLWRRWFGHMRVLAETWYFGLLHQSLRKISELDLWEILPSILWTGTGSLESEKGRRKQRKKTSEETGTLSPLSACGLSLTGACSHAFSSLQPYSGSKHVTVLCWARDLARLLRFISTTAWEGSLSVTLLCTRLVSEKLQLSWRKLALLLFASVTDRKVIEKYHQSHYSNW